MYAIIKDQKFTGVTYDSINAHIESFHRNQGDAILWVEVRPEEGQDVLFDQLKQAKLQEIASERYTAETAGVTVNGATIATDRTSQAMITGASLKAMQDETYTCQWKTPQGFVTLTAPQIIAIADAVRDHVQAQFDREATLTAQVDAATTPKELKGITWSMQLSS